jgi:hypothetical protein
MNFTFYLMAGYRLGWILRDGTATTLDSAFAEAAANGRFGIAATTCCNQMH